VRASHSCSAAHPVCPDKVLGAWYGHCTAAEPCLAKPDLRDSEVQQLGQGLEAVKDLRAEKKWRQHQNVS